MKTTDAAVYFEDTGLWPAPPQDEARSSTPLRPRASCPSRRLLRWCRPCRRRPPAGDRTCRRTRPLEALDGVRRGSTSLPRRAGEHFGDEERLRQEALDLAARATRQLVFFRQFVHAQDRDDILQRLVALKHLLHLTGNGVGALRRQRAGEHARRRVERVHRRINALGGDVARQHGGRRPSGRTRSPAPESVKSSAGHVDRLHRGDRTLCGGGDAFLQRAHVGGERRLIADRRRNTAQQRRHFEPACVKRKMLSTKNSTSWP